MKQARPYRHAFSACLFLSQVGFLIAGPQQVYYNDQNGQLRPLNIKLNCGTCPDGTSRETVSGPYCGRCLPITQSCAKGYYLDNGQCKPCPCPGTDGSRRFGTSCRVDDTGEVICDCLSEYIGRNCEQCAPGTIQNNQPPYDCIRINSTNSFSITCPSGNICNQPQIPNILQQRPTCPYTNQPVTSGCPYTNQTALCPGTNSCQQTSCNSNGCQQGNNYQSGGCQQVTPCQSGGCPVTSPCTQPCQTICSGGCPTNGNPQCPCPNPCGCPTNGCPGSCPVVQPPPCVVPTKPPTTVAPTIPPWTQPTPPPCPGPIRCPPPNPGPGCPGVQPPPNPGPGCPGVQPPPNPGPGCPGVQPPPNPGPGCPGVQPPPCPGQVQCPNPCQPCPYIPPCPPCILNCSECSPQVCQPCNEDGCQICPNPCQPCPDPCQRCPEFPGCPACNYTCPDCICDRGIVVGPSEPCLCDPRGTISQVGGQCICKVNVQGARCDQCKAGYFGLSSTRPEGCLACFCSGLSTSCSFTPYYRTSIRTDRRANCTIELTDENHSVVFSQGSSGFTWDGTQATLSKSSNNRLFWSLPACLKGDRVTSYGGILSFTRMCSGSGSQLGADHEVVLVASSGATIFWTTFEQQNCDGKWSSVDVLLAESAYWSSWKGEQYRRATRGDILEVLAELQLILVRATFTTNTLTTSIRNVSLSTVTHSSTTEGIAMLVESCRCPTGYRGLSCENCEPGYYRDTTDMSKSVFGACKPCPCGRTSDGCHLSGGEVVCNCKPGFSGPLCQDKEVITITCDPFRIREIEGSEVDFTCSYTISSGRRLLMRLGKEGSPEKAVDATSITKTIKLEKNLRRVACEVVDASGYTWAAVYCAIELVPQSIMIRPPPPRLIAMIPKETFICVEERTSVTLFCDMHTFGQRKITIEWRREGNPRIMGSGDSMTLHNVAAADSGTYICSASDGEVTGAGQIALMVRRTGVPLISQYPVNGTSNLERDIHARHGGDYPNYPYQKDGQAQPQADAPVILMNNTQQPRSPVQKISPVAPGHPKAMVEPEEVRAKPGDTVILRCNATGQEPLKFYWKSGSNDYIPVHVRISHGALIFRPLRSQDAGVYFCVAWNHLGQSTARATILLDNSTRNSPPISTGKPTVEILHPEIAAKPGENVNFQCRSNQTDVKYSWSRVDGRLPNSSEIRNDGLLTLYRVSEKEKGAYLCTVTNTKTGEKSTAQAVLTLTPMGEVLIPPRVAIRPKSPLRVKTGDKVRLECKGIGSPLPNVTWVRSIDGAEKKLVTTPTNQAIYEIKQMSTSDVGKYTCNAVSIAGRKSESMSLVIDDGKQCNENQFRCKSGDQCIPREDRCDTEKDCRDGSDEDNCKGSRRIRRRVKL